MHVIEHHIQREIIDRLMRAENLRFKDLKPDGMESNIFMYHLKRLTKEGFVTKADPGYVLAPKGIQYVDNLSPASSKPIAQPKAICILYIKNKAGNILVAQKKAQPFIGKYMLPSGKQRLDESVQQHVSRELQEKFNITRQAVRRGVTEVMLYDAPSRVLLTHVIGQVYEVEVTGANIPSETDRYTYTWHSDVGKLDFMPGTKELIDCLQEREELFFFSYNTVDK
jgi:ADP-ribose pyrophosphatase YjhB (NUDIX family)